MKGFFLSLDALAALAIVMIAVSLMGLVPQAAPAGTHATLHRSQQAHDDGILAFYARASPQSVSFENSTHGACSRVILPSVGGINLEDQPPNERADISPFSYCRVNP